ncbi:MAG: hypothetical protein J1D88_05575 [Treponema sp.]|nr:hypothetical protein [Treponema sp.]
MDKPFGAPAAKKQLPMKTYLKPRYVRSGTTKPMGKIPTAAMTKTFRLSSEHIYSNHDSRQPETAHIIQPQNTSEALPDTER